LQGRDPAGSGLASRQRGDSVGTFRDARKGRSQLFWSRDMKITIEVDCTPLEAREFMGLPDVQPMQEAMMDKFQQRMMDNIDKFSPDAIIQSWFTFDPKIAERFQSFFSSMAGLGSNRSSDKK
jgi:hypothetical protein